MEFYQAKSVLGRVVFQKFGVERIKDPEKRLIQKIFKLIFIKII
jgi:hypothetical protein